MKVLPIVLLLLLCICACNNNASEKLPTNSTSQNKNTEVKMPAVTVVNDTLIRMQFSASDTGVIATAQQYINGDEHIVCEVNIEKADSIYAAVTPLIAGGNIRFSQIIMPDEKADGPFGQTIQYSITKPGTYKLIIGENQMAGDKWKGNFRIKVWVK